MPVEIFEKVLDLFKRLKGKSRIEKLKILAEIMVALAEAAEKSDDPEVMAAIDEISRAVEARARRIRRRIIGT